MIYLLLEATSMENITKLPEAL